MLHRIRRQIIELDLPRERGATEVQRQVSRLMQEEVLPALERQFDALAPAGTWLRLDRLDLDLGTLSGPGWERAFVERAVAQIVRQVEQGQSVAVGSSSGQEAGTGATRVWDVLVYYLRTGRLPWYALRTSVAALLDELLAHLEAWTSQLRQLVLDTPVVLERLWCQLDEPQRRVVLARLLDADEALVARLVAPMLEVNGPTNEVAAVWHTVLRWRAEHPAEPLTNAMLAILRDEVAPTPAKRPAAASTVADLDFVSVEYAGLVLLTPYLATFLEATGLVAAGQFIANEHQTRAVHLLAYLASGAEEAEEPALVLPKLLCGLELEMPVPAQVTLTDVEKEEGKALLEAVIRNWPALKNSSVESLQQGFLQRPGQLVWHEGRGAWLLRVERLAHDVLLDRLPWGFSVVKLPWMEQMLQVEWGD